MILYNYMFRSKTACRKYAEVRCMRGLYTKLCGYRTIKIFPINEAPLRTACW